MSRSRKTRSGMLSLGSSLADWNSSFQSLKESVFSAPASKYVSCVLVGSARCANSAELVLGTSQGAAGKVLPTWKVANGSLRFVKAWRSSNDFLKLGDSFSRR